jgi:hypothetical protein
MSLNRAPFNALVDDDGTNTLGSPWNKAAIKDVILDPTDAELATYAKTTDLAPYAHTTDLPYTKGGPFLPPMSVGTMLTVVLQAATGYVDMNPAGVGLNYISWLLQPNGAGSLITGLLAQGDGTLRLLFNGSAYSIDFYPSHSSSAPGNRLITPGLALYTMPAWTGRWWVYHPGFQSWLMI